MNPCLLSVHNHQVILEQIEARENLNHDEYVEEDGQVMHIPYRKYINFVHLILQL